MRIIYGSYFFVIINMLPHNDNQLLYTSWALLAPLCLFILFITLRNQDFGQGFRTKLSALKKRLSFSAFSKEEDTIEFISELPKSDELPSVEEMAELLVQALPASDRSEAYTLLVTQLLPKKWARRPSFLAPRAQYEIIFDHLAEALQQAPQNQRLHFLRAELILIEIRPLSLDSHLLAIACYMQEHPDATPDAPLYWLSLSELSEWSAMSRADLENEACKRLEQLEQWEKLVKTNFSEIWEEEIFEHFKILLNLRSAYYGWFHTAMGELACFLHAVGASFEEIRLH